jgi:hypothetical protein
LDNSMINWKTKKYHTVGIVTKSNWEIIERGKTDAHKIR